MTADPGSTDSATARPTSPAQGTTETAPLRADARKNIAAIVEAAIGCLARDPDVSVGDIAKAAGVGRMTLYGHFPSRAALVSAAMTAAMTDSEALLSEVPTDGDPEAAMARLLEATWRLTHRYGALVVAAEQALPAEQVRAAHAEPFARMRSLLRRGRSAGTFRKDMPLDWQITAIHSIVHGASAAVHRGEITDARAPALIRGTVLGLLAPPG